MLKMTRNFSAILIAILLLAQIGIAQHSTIHFSDHTHYEHANHNDEHDEHDNELSKECQTCLIIKSLSISLDSNQAMLTNIARVDLHFLKIPTQPLKNITLHSYNPRAPPVFLI
jgi:hypothetical protein